jgi:Protein of unknown function (DUF2510)
MTNRENKSEGWYTDPLGQADLRWWDSRNWTEHLKGVRGPDARTKRFGPASSAKWAEAEDFPEPATLGRGEAVVPPRSKPSAEPQFALFAKATNASATRDREVHTGPDWSELAIALLMAGDDIVHAKAAGIPELTIDMVERIYWWERDLDSFPAYPDDLQVTTTARAEAAVPSIAGRYIEPLLWRVGIGSLADAMFKRVDPTLRYKLRRWPDLSSMPHTANQLRMMTMLANAQLTPAELSAVTEIPAREVMSLLDVVKDPAAAARER